MNDLIKINYEQDTPTISGRELHEKLEVQTAYKDWFPRMCEYGFTEGVDFNPLKFEQVQIEGNRQVNRTITDHALTIPMAKELCMLQRTDKGKMFRQWFIQIEEAWNTPEKIMARALQIASRELDASRLQIAKLAPKADYTDKVLQSDSLLPITKIAKDYGMSGKAFNELLCELGIQYKMGRTWLLYADHDDKGYTQSRTHIINDSGNTVVHTYWTQRGGQFLYDFLAKKRNLRPVAERLALS